MKRIEAKERRGADLESPRDVPGIVVPTAAEADELERALAEADRAGPDDWIPAAAVLQR